SLGLTIATLGMGSLIETGGMAALKAAGIAAPEIADIVKGAQIVQKATRAGKTAEEGYAAAEAAGVSKELLTHGLQTLSDASLDTGSLLSKSVVRNSVTKLLPKAGVSLKTSDRIGQGIAALTTAGFTAQQVQQAAELSPQFLDAIKDGDYEKAKRLGVNI